MGLPLDQRFYISQYVRAFRKNHCKMKGVATNKYILRDIIQNEYIRKRFTSPKYWKEDEMFFLRWFRYVQRRDVGK